MADRIRRAISAVEVLGAIDESKLGPDSPLRALLKVARRNKSQDLEHREQVALFAWAHDHEKELPELKLLFAVPNFAGRLGRYTAKHGARLKAEGRKPGVPDVWLPIARGRYHGLVLEMKAGHNRPTVDQSAWLEALSQQGYCTIIAYSALEAQSALRTYLTSIQE